ncbi:MAG: CAP domain-containing protein [Jaaginema sp. PMC 1079.18]|nr:CAP domain-containing protein [Jaaginema sp. PMC 1080.18]MEC4850706.1 CAP domain-containing protein [Jaaginema sp. PMC 1079.18]MEC4864711.1 CAP domain-containing protein [Jaaginema sp. PMC 1078.18]
METVHLLRQDTEREQISIAEINRLRRDPASYIPVIKAYLQRSPAVDTGAAQEIIWYLASATPVSFLTRASGLTIIAQKRAQKSNRDSTTLSQELQPYGKLSGAIAEVYSSNTSDLQMAIAAWLVGTGESRRQSRSYLLNPLWQSVGVYGGEDGQYHFIFAENYLDYPDLSENKLVAGDEMFLQAVNQLRLEPQSYIPILQTWRDRFVDTVRVAQLDNTITLTKEGIDAVNEAIAVLQTTPPVEPLSLSWGMTQAARDLVREQSQTGEFGAVGSDRRSPQERLEQYGCWQGRWVQSLCYGQSSPEAVLKELLIGDGRPQRRDRDYLLNPQFSQGGIATGFHPLYQSMSVLLLANHYYELT